MIDLSGLMNLADKEDSVSSSRKRSSNPVGMRRKVSGYEPPFESDSYSSLERLARRDKHEEQKQTDFELLSKESGYSDYS